MNPILADAINLPFVLAIGLAVAVPLLVFQIGVEGFVLSRSWTIPFRELWQFVFRANFMSLLAGIPTKIVNSFIYAAMLSKHIPEFIARYPLAVTLGTLVYFIVTVLVEGRCAIGWTRRNSVPLSGKQIWLGILWANIATYLVMAPLHYYATRTRSDVREYTTDVNWAQKPDTRLVFIDLKTKHLKTKTLSDTHAITVIDRPVEDFVISSNLDLCLYRGTNGFLHLWRKEPATNSLVWEAKERFSMNEVAFSPFGTLVAFVYDEGSLMEVAEITSGRRRRLSLPDAVKGLRELSWTTNENQFVLAGGTNRPWLVTIAPDLGFTHTLIEDTNEISLAPFYGRFFKGSWPWSGYSSYQHSECGERSLFAIGGLGSAVRIFHKDDVDAKSPITIAVNPGLLHVSSIAFVDATFLEGCEECLIRTWDHIYLFDIENKRLGTVCAGGPYVTITPRFLKQP